MFSQTTQSHLLKLQPHAREIFDKLLQECHKSGTNAQISESLRTDERQQELYKQGKSKANEGKKSMHYYGIACDIFVNSNGKTDYSHNNKIWEICQMLNLHQGEEGMRWGGNFKSFNDIPHFELSGGKNWKYFWDKYGDSAQHICNTNNPSITKKQENTTQATFSKTMSNSIISSLAEKGIDLASSFIPGGSLVQSAVKSIAKSLLGNENASESEVAKAVQNANPEQLEVIRLEIEKTNAELEKEKQDTRQEEEKTAQMQIQKDEKFMDLILKIINEGKGKYVVFCAIAYYILLFLVGTFYHFSDFDIYTKHCVIGLLTVMCFIPFSSFIGNGIMNKILNALCDIFLNIAEIGKGITAVPKMVASKILKK